MLRRLLLILVVLALAFPALAWNATGHMVISEIAYKRLMPKARREIERLLKIGGTPTTNDVLTAAVWADDARTRQNGPWHYIDLYFRLDGKTTNLKPDSENVVWAMSYFALILQNRNRPDSERADALRYLLHFVGDIHQPLHCVALVSDQFPEGDRGGNLYAVAPRSGGRIKNLHYLWDSAAGFFPNIERPLETGSRAEIASLAMESLRSVSAGDLRRATNVHDPMAWAKEGQDIARKDVYSTPDGVVPSSDYLEKCKRISRNRAAIAGARLADLLNRLLS